MITRFTLLILPFLLVGCTSPTGPQPPDAEPVRVGTLVGIDLATWPDSEAPMDTPNLWIAVGAFGCGVRVDFGNNPQVLFRDAGGRFRPIAHTELDPGLRVELWVPPGEGFALSCPTTIRPSHIVASALEE
jgi:hypothetical protein